MSQVREPFADRVETGDPTPGTTPVSDWAAPVLRRSGVIRALARRSLWCAAMLLVTGCLDGTPEYTAPTRLPPVIDTFKTLPLINTLALVEQDSPTTVLFTVPFRSEDAGTELTYYFLLDVDNRTLPRPLETNIVEPDPRPLEEQEGRVATFEWQPESELSGCHTITFIITYVDNFGRNFVPRDPSLADSVTWWFQVGDDADLSRCPGGGQAQ